MDRTEQMREAALSLEKALARSPAHFVHMEQWRGYKDGVQDYAAAIRALPLPPQPPLADDVAGVVRFIRMWEAFRRDRGGFFDADKFAAAADLIERLARDRDFLLTCGIIELMIRNPNVDSYVKEWEARAEKAEAALASSMTDATNDFLLVCIERDELQAEVARLQEVLAVDPWTIGWSAWRARAARAALTPKGADHG